MKSGFKRVPYVYLSPTPPIRVRPRHCRQVSGDDGSTRDVSLGVELTSLIFKIYRAVA